jgi:hypothetical protein
MSGYTVTKVAEDKYIVGTDGWFKEDEHLPRNLPGPYSLIVDVPGTRHPVLPNIYLQVEPIVPCFEDYLINNQGAYYKIFTFNQRVLDNCPNAVKYLYGTSWIPSSVWLRKTKKRFAVSTLAGSKNISSGHIFRILVHFNQSLLSKLSAAPITFYRSTQQRTPIDFSSVSGCANPLIPAELDGKKHMFEEYQYSVVIENDRHLNYFTEKLIDCLLMKTIPIYYGCPNIEEYFDPTGWIVLDEPSPRLLGERLGELTEDYYGRYEAVIEANVERAKKYMDLRTNLEEAVKKYIL